MAEHPPVSDRYSVGATGGKAAQQAPHGSCVRAALWSQYSYVGAAMELYGSCAGAAMELCGTCAGVAAWLFMTSIEAS